MFLLGSGNNIRLSLIASNKTIFKLDPRSIKAFGNFILHKAARIVALHGSTHKFAFKLGTMICNVTMSLFPSLFIFFVQSSSLACVANTKQAFIGILNLLHLSFGH